MNEHGTAPPPPSYTQINWPTKLWKHSPDSPLDERSEGDLDCDLFFFLW